MHKIFPAFLLFFSCLTGVWKSYMYRPLQMNNIEQIQHWYPKPASPQCQMRFHLIKLPGPYRQLISPRNRSFHLNYIPPMYTLHVVMQANFGGSSVTLFETKKILKIGKSDNGFSVHFDPKIITSQFQVRKLLIDWHIPVSCAKCDLAKRNLTQKWNSVSC